MPQLPVMRRWHHKSHYRVFHYIMRYAIMQVCAASKLASN
jgi:hypothetical protein